MSQNPVGSVVEELGNCLRLEPSFRSNRRMKSSLEKSEWCLWCSVNHLEIFILEVKCKDSPYIDPKGRFIFKLF